MTIKSGHFFLNIYFISHNYAYTFLFFYFPSKQWPLWTSSCDSSKKWWQQVTTTWSSNSGRLITMSFLSAITVTNRKSLATVRLWAQHSSRSLVFERVAWANARSHASLHAVAARGRLFKSFRMALGFIWEQEITGRCMLNHLVRRKLRGIAKQRMFILQVVLFSQLRQWHMHIHRTYTSTVYCSYDYVHCKQSVYWSSFSYFLFYFIFLYVMVMN